MHWFKLFRKPRQPRFPLWLFLVVILSAVILSMLEDWEERRAIQNVYPESTVVLVQFDDEASGCGDTFTEYDIPVLSLRLQSVLRALSEFDPPEGWINPFREQGITVHDVQGDIVDIVGQPSLGGICDRSLLKQQIEKTIALYRDRFSIRLNGSEEEYECMRDVTGSCE